LVAGFVTIQAHPWAKKKQNSCNSLRQGFCGHPFLSSNDFFRAQAFQSITIDNATPDGFRCDASDILKKDVAGKRKYSRRVGTSLDCSLGWRSQIRISC
jgi:hypothetical protein